MLLDSNSVLGSIGEYSSVNVGGVNIFNRPSVDMSHADCNTMPTTPPAKQN